MLILYSPEDCTPTHAFRLVLSSAQISKISNQQSVLTRPQVVSARKEKLFRASTMKLVSLRRAL